MLMVVLLRALRLPGLGAPLQIGDVCRRSIGLTKPELHDLRLKVRRSVLEAMREMGGAGQRHDILGRALSIGSFTHRELEAEPAKHSRPKYSRLIDHDLSWALTDLKRDGLATNPTKGIWRLTANALMEPETPLAQAGARERLAELRLMPYDEYLLHSRRIARRSHSVVPALPPRHHLGNQAIRFLARSRSPAAVPSDRTVAEGSDASSIFVPVKASAAKMRSSRAAGALLRGVPLTLTQAAGFAGRGHRAHRFGRWSSTRRQPPSRLVAHER